MADNEKVEQEEKAKKPVPEAVVKYVDKQIVINTNLPYPPLIHILAQAIQVATEREIERQYGEQEVSEVEDKEEE